MRSENLEKSFIHFIMKFSLFLLSWALTTQQRPEGNSVLAKDRIKFIHTQMCVHRIRLLQVLQKKTRLYLDTDNAQIHEGLSEAI